MCSHTNRSCCLFGASRQRRLQKNQRQPSLRSGPSICKTMTLLGLTSPANISKWCASDTCFEQRTVLYICARNDHIIGSASWQSRIVYFAMQNVSHVLILMPVGCHHKFLRDLPELDAMHGTKADGSMIKPPAKSCLWKKLKTRRRMLLQPYSRRPGMRWRVIRNIVPRN